MKTPRIFFTGRLFALTLALTAFLSMLEILPMYISGDYDIYWRFIGVQFYGVLITILIVSILNFIHRILNRNDKKAWKIASVIVRTAVYLALFILTIQMNYDEHLWSNKSDYELFNLIFVLAPAIYIASCFIADSKSIKKPVIGSVLSLIAGGIIMTALIFIKGRPGLYGDSSFGTFGLIYAGAFFGFNAAVIRSVLLRHVFAEESERWALKHSPDTPRTVNVKARRILKKTAKWILALAFLVFAAGWIFTLPRPDYYMTTSAGPGSGKVVIVRSWFAYSLDDPMKNIVDFYNHFHWIKKADVWLYDLDKDKLEKKNWRLPYVGIPKYKYAAKTDRLVTNGLIKTHGNVISAICVLNNNGKKDFEYKHPTMITSLLMSPDESKLFFQDYNQKKWIYNIKTREARELTDFPTGANSFVWPQGSSIYFIRMPAIEKEKENERGIYSYDIESGATKMLLRHISFMSIDSKGKVLGVLSGVEQPEKNNAERVNEALIFSLPSMKQTSRFIVIGYNPHLTLLPTGKAVIIRELLKSKSAEDSAVLRAAKAIYKRFDLNGKYLGEADVTGFFGDPFEEDRVSEDVILGWRHGSRRFLGINSSDDSSMEAALFNVKTGKIETMSKILLRHGVR